MTAAGKKYEIDMCNGPLFGKIILFAVPLMATCILQLLFNAADLIVIGRFAHYNSMAAIGATMNLNALVINLFGGLAIGTNVVVAKFIGEKSPENVTRAVHTSMMLALCGGIVLMTIGLFIARPMLVLMQTPAEVLPLSCKYLWICFCAIPFIMIYNFGCSILRAVGDTRRPLIFLSIAGVVNIVLNLIFVIYCNLDVAGVALATAISHGIAAALIVRTLLTAGSDYRLLPEKLKLELPMLKQILAVGLPAGLQSSFFAVSNMLIQSSINSFGAIAMAGMTTALSLEGIVFTCVFAFNQSAISFVSQNLGAGKYKRIIQSYYMNTACSIAATAAMGFGFFLCGRWLLAIFNPEPEVIAYGMLRMKILFTTYALCGIMEVAGGSLRGMGYSVTAMVISLFGACVFRIFWVLAVFPRWHSLESLLASYPVSWGLTSVIAVITFFAVFRKKLRSDCNIHTPWMRFTPGITRGLRYLLGSK